jgi:hypothetical protein
MGEMINANKVFIERIQRKRAHMGDLCNITVSHD